MHSPSAGQLVREVNENGEVGQNNITVTSVPQDCQQLADCDLLRNKEFCLVHSPQTAFTLPTLNHQLKIGIETQNNCTQAILGKIV